MAVVAARAESLKELGVELIAISIDRYCFCSQSLAGGRIKQTHTRRIFFPHGF